MLSKYDNDKPLTKEEAPGPPTRPPPEKYDPDELPYWSMTMTAAWIIWRNLDAVRSEWDDYRKECADWRFKSDPRAQARVGRILIDNITGQTSDPDPETAALKKAALEKDLAETLPNLRNGAWHYCSWKPSRWETMRAPLEQKRSALKALLRAAGDGKIQATALAYENVKAYLDDPYAGEPIDIPPTHWAYLKLDPSGRPILLGPGGRVYRDVQFRRLSVKEQWPPLSVEPIESGTVVALSESPEPEPERIEASEPEPERVEEALPESAGPTEPKAGPQWERAERYIKKHFPHDEKLTYDRDLAKHFLHGVDDSITTATVFDKLDKDPALKAELGGRRMPSMTLINRMLGRRKMP